MYIHVYAKNWTEEKTVETQWIPATDPNNKQDMAQDSTQLVSSCKGLNLYCSIIPQKKKHFDIFVWWNIPLTVKL